MPRKVLEKSTRRLAPALTLLTVFALTGCALPTLTWPGAAPTASLDAGPTIRAFVCDEITVVHWHAGKITADGKPDLAQADVTAALARADWQAQLHHILGDTDDTIVANKLNNSVLDALCNRPTGK